VYPSCGPRLAYGNFSKAPPQISRLHSWWDLSSTPLGEGPGSLQQLPRTESVGDRRSGYAGGPVTDSLNLAGSQQHTHRPGQSHPPPLLTSESKNRSFASSASTGSSALFTPRTPMELPLERSLLIPLLYSQKSSLTFENQLPPLRPPSLSPHSTWLGSQQSAESRLEIFCVLVS
jgi:hypothetical protein